MTVPQVGSAPPESAAPQTSRKREDPEKIAEAARQFESVLIAQLLKSMRSSGDGGWLGTGEDPTASAAMDMAEEQFAGTLSAQGGLGLAQMVIRGLTEAESATAASSDQ